MLASTAASVDLVALAPHDTRAFIRFPWQVYAHDRQWVPPLIIERKAFLNPRKNPFFQHAQVQLFLARRQGQVVGRIAAVVNTAHDHYHNERAGFFGLFECLPDAAVATVLLEAAQAWVRERGATFLRGPVNLSTNELDCGLLVEGFETPPVFQSAYNPPYYAPLLETCGFTKCKDLLAFSRSAEEPLAPPLLDTIARLHTQRNIRIRTVNMRHFAAEVARITAIYNEAWSDNWGFVPITTFEAQHLAKALRLAVIPELTLVAEIDAEPVGCFVAVPDLNQALRHIRGRLTPWSVVRLLYHRRRINTARVIMMGVKKRYRRLGIDLLLYAESWQQGRKRGIVRGEMAWILEDNRVMIRTLAFIGAQPCKRYRLYQKSWL
jgi:GNAT superfamily N-acetyltransferase